LSSSSDAASKERVAAKESLLLKKKRGPHVEFLSCDATPDDDLRAVAWFEVRRKEGGKQAC
jgi:hypothetical protein